MLYQSYKVSNHVCSKQTALTTYLFELEDEIDSHWNQFIDSTYNNGLCELDQAGQIPCGYFKGIDRYSRKDLL